jgi:hypothetical protein
MSSVTSGVCGGRWGVYLLYVHSFAFKYRYILFTLTVANYLMLTQLQNNVGRSLASLKSHISVTGMYGDVWNVLAVQTTHLAVLTWIPWTRCPVISPDINVRTQQLMYLHRSGHVITLQVLFNAWYMLRWLW